MFNGRTLQHAGATCAAGRGGGRVALFDNSYGSTLAFLDSLGRHGVAVDVFSAARLGTTRWSRYAGSYRHCPPLDQADEFVPWLRDQVRAGAIMRVAATTDLLAYYLSLLRDEFSPPVRATLPTLGEMENCLIKSRFASVCDLFGIAIPATSAPASIDEALNFADRVGYPVLLKAKSHLAVGMAERGGVIRSPAELRRQFREYTFVGGHDFIAARYPELRLPLLQQFVPSAAKRVYSISGFKHAEHGVVAAALSYKGEQWPVNVGVSTYQVGCTDKRILGVGVAAVERLVSCGIFELELLADGDELLAIDLNPRGFGFMQLDISRGNDLPWLWYQSTLGLLPSCGVAAELPSVECRQAVPFYVSRLRGLMLGPNRREKLDRFVDELRRPWISMLGDWQDPIPKLLAHVCLLRNPGSLFRAGGEMSCIEPAVPRPARERAATRPAADALAEEDAGANAAAGAEAGATASDASAAGESVRISRRA